MKTKPQLRNVKTAVSRGVHSLTAVLLALMMVFGYFPSTAWADDGSSYYFGQATEYSTFNKESKDLKDSYYYSDSWFEKDPSERNDELALVSMQLVAASVEDSADSNGGDFLKGLGFTETGFENNGKQDKDSCNYTHAKKTLPDGRTLVAVVIQSFSEDSEIKEQGWKQNFIVNGESQTSGEHFALAKAADKVVESIESLGGSNTVFWITGQSRGGALAGLIAKRLGDHGNNVYAYTFESPAVTDAGSAGDYGYIHNYLCRDDIVTKIPMWGMTRYGNVYELKTDETDEGIQEELRKIGSEAAEEDVPDSEWMETDIVDYLSERVASRADYSRARSDTFTDIDTGEEKTVAYSYQESLTNLIAAITSGELSGAAGLIDNVEKLIQPVETLVEAVKLDGTDEAMPLYYAAAKGLHENLEDTIGSDISLSVSDLYAVLKLIGPFAVNTEHEPYDDPASDVLGYMGPAVSIAASAGAITYSHQFDTLIARLKILAPAPVIEEIEMTIPAPEAGDDVNKASQDLKEFFDDELFKDAADNPWISAEAAWDTDDETLQDDYIYYLDVTLETVGHTVPEDISLMFNGMTPVGKPVITYDEGTGITRVTFEFQFGEPPETEVSFDTGGKTAAPDPITVKRGTSLATKDAPEVPEIVTVDGVKYKLKGWYAQDGTPWDDVKVSEPMTMYAKWLIYVDLLDISFDLPELGDEIEPASVPEDAPYYILEQYCDDPGYDTVYEASSEGEYHLNLNLALKDPENSVFALGKDEWDFYEYLGSTTINGEEINPPDYSEDLYYGLSVNYDEEGGYVRVEYEFPVIKDDAETAQYTFISGDGQTWTKGSEENVAFTVKRSPDDEEIINHFTELDIDGNTVSKDDFTAEKGSLILNILPSYLETLTEGSHTVTVIFDDGTAEAHFTVASDEQEETAPADSADSGQADDADGQPVKTGDTTDLMTLLILLIASGTMLVGLLAYKKR